VLELLLTVTTHHQQIATAEVERSAATAAPRPEQEGPRLPQGQQDDDGGATGSTDPVTVPGHAVATGSVPIEAHAVEPFAVTAVEVVEELGDDGVRQPALPFVPGGQPGLVDESVEHHATPLGPLGPSLQRLEQLVRAGQPGRAVLQPGALAQQLARQRLHRRDPHRPTSEDAQLERHVDERRLG
jgi:hypothetical protein